MREREGGKEGEGERKDGEKREGVSKSEMGRDPFLSRHIINFKPFKHYFFKSLT